MAFLSGNRGGFLGGQNLNSGGTVTGDLVVTGTINTGAATLASAVVSGATTLTGAVAANNHITMGSGKVLYLDPGTDGAPSLSFVGATTTGWNNNYGGTAGNPGFFRAGTAMLSFSTSGILTRSTLNVDTGGLVIGSTNQVRYTPSPKTGNYTLQASLDACVSFTGVGLTATLPATPTHGQSAIILNIHATENLTVARNGKLILGLASDVTVLPMTGVELVYNSTAGNWAQL